MLQVIRAATTGDAPAIARVHVLTWRHAYRGLIDDEYLDALDPEARARRWTHILEGRRSTVLVAETGGEVAGFASVGPSDQDGWGEVYAIYVLPSRWGHGLGARLLRRGEDALSQAGFDRALLWVLEGNGRARRFYEKRGWKPGKPVRLEDIGARQLTELRYEKPLTADSASAGPRDG